MCPPPRSLALEANGCFMVWVQPDSTEYKVAARGIARHGGLRWLASSKQRFAFGKWNLCRLVSSFAGVGVSLRSGSPVDFR
jgi:hypothetical protein